MSTEMISIEHLAVSPYNVRKSYSKSALEEMKASILSHGLMQNLVVTKGDDGKYLVVAGARRLAAMQGLYKEGKYPDGCMVPCLVEDADFAAELSLAENTVREEMHPADEFDAFAALSKDHAPEEIAVRFGVTTRHVQQRMRLARVAPELMKAYRAGDMDLDALMAFTLSDEHNHQRKVFKATGRKPNAHSVRRLMTEKSESSKGKLCKFVSLKAYVDAGGKVREDLFGSETFLEDPKLLHEVANQKLTALEDELRAEGWGWVKVALEDEYGFTHKYGQLQPKKTQPPQELVQKHAKLAKACEKLENQLRDIDDDDARYAELDAKSDEMVAQLEAVETEIDGYSKFDPEQMKSAGVYARLDYDGKLKIDRGLVSKAAERKLEATKSGKKPVTEEKGMSQALRLSLQAFRLQAAQVAIASKPELAYDLLVFGAAQSVLSKECVADGLDIKFFNRTPIMGDVKNTEAAKALAEIKEKLSLEWLDLKTEAEMFDGFQTLTAKQKSAILAFCVALTAEPALAPKTEGDVSAYDKTLALTGVDVATYWRPTKENYLSRVTHDELRDISEKVLSPAWRGQHARTNKTDFAEKLHTLFAAPKINPIGPGTAETIARWLPEGMAFTLPEKKAKAKKKAA